MEPCSLRVDFSLHTYLRATVHDKTILQWQDIYFSEKEV